MAQRSLLLASAAVLLAACTGPAPGEGYFPLQGGHRWVYRVQQAWENNTVETVTQTMETLGSETLPDGGSAWRRRSDGGVDYWLRADASGVYRVASKTDVQAQGELDQPQRYVLKAPFALGTTWQASTTSYLLRRRNEFPPEIRHSHRPVAMTYRIEAVGETVKTPAGSFNNCLRVQGTAAMRLFADPVGGFRDVPLLTTEWYCQGVGLVKLERKEAANSTFLLGGSVVMELLEWR